MSEITSNKITRQNLLPRSDGSKPYGVEVDKLFTQNIKLLDRFKSYYDSLAALRENRERCVRYYFGDQLSDLVPNPDGGDMITEAEYMKKQGIIPMTMNIIRKGGKAIVGVYRQSRLEPLVIARDRDEQKLGEMMSIVMEYIYQNLNLPEANARGFEEALLSAIVCFRVGYDINEERGTSDVVVNLCDINRMAWNDNTTGQYFESINTIGYLHDLSMGDVLKRFARSKADKEKILQIYQDWDEANPISQQQFQRDGRKRNIDFYQPLESDKCRVIEIWTKEQYDSYEFHDTAKGEQIFSDEENDADIIAENNRRVFEIVQAGGSAEDAKLIEYVGYRVMSKWVVRYLSPNGYVLHQGLTPYWHGSHPFAIGAYPLVDGEIHSLVSDVIDIQRVYNSTFMRNLWMRTNAAKGFGVVNQNILDKSNVTIDEFAKQFTSADGIVALRWESGEKDDIFVKYADNSVNVADEHTMQQCLDLMEKVYGTNSTLLGERAHSGTPAALYAQETNNASNNITDQIEWYNGLIRKRDYKIMMVAQQYYQDRRYINIAGKDYSEESKWYDPEKVRNSKFDLALVENQSQGMFRVQNEQLLMSLLQSQQIDLQTYLESSSSPFADKLLERVKSRQKEMAEAQQQQAMLQQQQGAIPQAE